jgi:hypothetical protein
MSFEEEIAYADYEAIMVDAILKGRKEGEEEGIEKGENRVLEMIEKGMSSSDIRKELAKERS